MSFDRHGVTCVGLILTEMYPFYGAVLAAESMRLANKYSNDKMFDWVFISEDGLPVAASNGMSLITAAAKNIQKLDYAFVIAGYDPDRQCHPNIKALLRRLGRQGTVLGAVDSGAFVLAEAGVLAGQATAIHFESRSAFQHKYPCIAVVDEPVSISTRLMTCGAGALVIRLILAITRTRIGELVAGRIESDLHLSALASPGPEPAQISVKRSQGRPRVDEVIALMGRTVDKPVSLRKLARHSGCSTRQLTRAFNHRFGASPMRYYQRLRLTHARQLLYQGAQPISEVAMSCGFTALSLFSRAFKTEFGQSPSKFMAAFRREGFSRFIPTSLESYPLDLMASGGEPRARRLSPSAARPGMVARQISPHGQGSQVPDGSLR
jgi:AraC family carnitine catabolism transcriptional activator